jgi:hypothetical protein
MIDSWVWSVCGRGFERLDVMIRFPALAGVIAVIFSSSMVAAQGNVSHAGTVAAVLGSLEATRSAAVVPMRVGDAVLVGDRLQTRAGDRAKLLLADDTVVNIGSASEVTIEAQTIDRDTEASETVLVLGSGQARIMSAKAKEGEGRLEVETPAAVAFRGSDYVVTYDAATSGSRVVALEGPVSVAGKVGVVGGLVELEEGASTVVAKGRLPGPPSRLTAEQLVEAARATSIVGTGRRDGLDVLHPVARGKLLATGDVPTTRAGRATSGLRLGTPQESLADRLSADVRTNTEPLLEYKRRRPGAPSITGVEVEF